MVSRKWTACLQAIAGLQTAEGQQDFRREMQRLQHELHQEQENRASMQVTWQCFAQLFMG